jgi:hypothetical protein
MATDTNSGFIEVTAADGTARSGGARVNRLRTDGGTLDGVGGFTLPAGVGGTDATSYKGVGTPTGAEFGYLSGVTSSIQTQINNRQPSDATLTALAAFNSNGILVQTAADTFASRTITAPAAGIGVTNGDGVAGNPTLSLANDLAALEGLGGTGLAARTGADAWAQRTITGTANQVTVTNGDGVAGNPTLSLPQDIHTGASPSFASLALSGTIDAAGHAAFGATASVDQNYGVNASYQIINARETYTGYTPKTFGGLLWLTIDPAADYPSGQTPEEIGLQTYLDIPAGNTRKHYGLMGHYTVVHHDGTGAVDSLMFGSQIEAGVRQGASVVDLRGVHVFTHSNGNVTARHIAINANPNQNAGTVADLRGVSSAPTLASGATASGVFASLFASLINGGAAQTVVGVDVFSNAAHSSGGTSTGLIGVRVGRITHTGTVSGDLTGLDIADQTLVGGTVSGTRRNIYSRGATALNVFEGPVRAGELFVNVATANLYLKDASTGFQSATSTIITPQSGNTLRNTSYTSGLTGWSVADAGNAEFNNVTIRGAIRASIFTYNSVSATSGTLGVFKASARLRAALVIGAGAVYNSATFTLDVDDQEGLSHAASQVFAVNDALLIKDGLIGYTWIAVTAVSDQTTFWRYTVLLKAGTRGVTYPVGMAVVDYGQGTQGNIVLTADQANAPYIQMAQSGSYTSFDATGTLIQTPLLRIGNLNGSYGYSSNVYGFAAGQHGVAGQSWVTVEQTNGVRLGSNTTTRIHLAADGSGFLANSNISWTTAGVATISGWTIGTAAISSTGINIASGASAHLAFGATPPTSASAGTGLFLDRTGLYGLASNVVQAKFDAGSGKITAGGTNGVEMGASGIVVNTQYSAKTADSISWYSTSAAADLGGMNFALGTLASSLTTATLTASGPNPQGGAVINLYAKNSASAFAEVQLYKYGASHGTRAGVGELYLNLDGVLIQPQGTGSTRSTSAMLDVRGNVLSTGSVLSSGTAGIGYATGAGGTVTQITSKGTAVTLNKICGQIVTHSAALGAGAEATFQVNNSLVAATDAPYAWVASGGTLGAYFVQTTRVAAGSFQVTISNISAGSLSEAITIGFFVNKAVTA